MLRQAQASRDAARNYAILQVLLQTGIRLSECSGLTLGDITFDERSGMLLVRAGKGNKVRSVPLNSSARDALATLMAPRLGVDSPSIKAVAAKWPTAKTPEAFLPVFESQKGGALSTSAMGQMIADLVRSARHLVPETTSAHTLRHTFARWYLGQYPGDLLVWPRCSVIAHSIPRGSIANHRSNSFRHAWSNSISMLIARRVSFAPLRDNIACRCFFVEKSRVRG